MAQDDTVTRKLKNQLEKLYPDKTLATNTDIMIYLDYQLFMRSLIEEAERIAENENSRRIDESHVEKAANVVLQKFRG
ncbi:hypothetical protein BCR43DRAFT_491567 [Syncephalastrum racemosum]|uniref:Transcription factor CBF/NF-Y/archaeal histone domain-containing protein n=1 Tax=Syncephalastrum racemosum TaxID=13706 RepID=A0A1X2HC84_SYNRA|nr:hypothetical protein BCR43DRAFT_491567 [Syncephalastrum racemosum]